METLQAFQQIYRPANAFFCMGSIIILFTNNGL